MTVSLNLNRFEQDLDSAFRLLLWTADSEEDYNPRVPLHASLFALWTQAVSKGEHERYLVAQAKNKFRYWNHSRSVYPSAKNCPIIVGVSSAGNYIVLDGSHRLITAILEEVDFINVFFVNVSFSDTVEDMEVLT